MRNRWRRPDSRDPSTVRALRQSLAAHAERAPDADAVADRIVASVARRTPVEPHRSWRAFALPVLAAGSVAAVVGAVVLVQQVDRPAAPTAANSHSLVPSSPSVEPTPSLPTSRVPTSSSAPVDTSTLHNVQVIDLTFVGPDDGWALASADCIGHAGRCPALLRTHDGTTWRSMPGTQFNVDGQTGGCAYPCVEHLRFATDRIGYAFGPDALLMTTDGGLHWTRQRGGADALETLDGNAVRLESRHSGCPGPCDLQAELSPIGSAGWTPIRLSQATINAASVSLARTGTRVFVETSFGPAGSLYGVTLYTSADDGETWAQRADPCRQYGSPVAGTTVVSRNLTTADDGSVTVYCAGAGGTPRLIVTSTDGGMHFIASPLFTGAVASERHGEFGPVGASSSRVLIGCGYAGLFRSVDSGRNWTRVPSEACDGNVVPPAFEDSAVGRYVGPTAATIWTTRDAGATWSKTTLT